MPTQIEWNLLVAAYVGAYASNIALTVRMDILQKASSEPVNRAVLIRLAQASPNLAQMAHEYVLWKSALQGPRPAWLKDVAAA